MKNKSPQFSYATEVELLRKFMFFLSSILPELPSTRLKDCCRGARALLCELSNYYELKP